MRQVFFLQSQKKPRPRQHYKLCIIYLPFYPSPSAWRDITFHIDVKQVQVYSLKVVYVHVFMYLVPVFCRNIYSFVNSLSPSPCIVTVIVSLLYQISVTT